MSHILKLQKLNSRARGVEFGDLPGELLASSISTVCPSRGEVQDAANPFEME